MEVISSFTVTYLTILKSSKLTNPIYPFDPTITKWLDETYYINLMPDKIVLFFGPRLLSTLPSTSISVIVPDFVLA
jgi:hypothetical protein